MYTLKRGILLSNTSIDCDFMICSFCVLSKHQYQRTYIKLMKCLSTLKNKILATIESCSMGTSLNSYYLAEKKNEKAVSNGKASNASSCDIESL